MNTRASLLIPFDITAGMIAEGTTVPEVDASAGEVAFNPSAASYETGALVAYGGSIWEALKDLSDDPDPIPSPGDDATAWLRFGPTNRMAPFDDRLDTKTVRPGGLTFVVRPGFVTGLALYGLVGDHLTVRIYDAPGGNLAYEYDSDLVEQAMGLYELLFMPLKAQHQFFLPDIDLFADPEVVITITGATSEVALISMGNWDTFLGSVPDLGGVKYEAEAEIKSYSYMKRNDDGSVTRKRRGSASNVNCTIVIAASEANHAAAMLKDVQGRPVAFIVTNVFAYEYLNGFGDVSGTVVAAGYPVAIVNLRLEGAVEGVTK